MNSNEGNTGVLHHFDLEMLPESVNQDQVREVLLESVHGTGMNTVKNVDRDVNVFTSKIPAPSPRFPWDKIEMVSQEDGDTFMANIIKPALRKIGIDLDVLNKETKSNNIIFPFYSQKQANFKVTEHGNVQVESYGTNTEYSADGRSILRTHIKR